MSSNKPNSKLIARSRRDNRAGWLMASPWILGFCFFMLIPVIVSVFLSLTNYSLLSAPEFIGLDNYKKMLFNDPNVWHSMGITILYAVVNVPLTLALSFILALLINRKIRGVSLFRTIFYLPTIISGVAVGLLWTQIFNPDFGILSLITENLFGISGIQWLNDPKLVLPSLILVSLWGLGRSMIINLSGLQSIPTELYESASIDGCTGLRSVFRITIPMMTPTIFLNLITGIIGAFQTFTNAYVMTSGGPNKASLFYMLYLYQNAFKNFRMGYASALSWLLFLVVLVLTYVVFWSSNRWVYYESGEGK